MKSMNKLVLFFWLSLINFGLFAQEEEEVVEYETVLFSLTTTAPIYPGCEEVDSSEFKNCFSESIMEYLNTILQYPKMALELGIQEDIHVSFIIDSTGTVSDVKIIKGENKSLREEAIRIVSLLPKMKPATQRDRPVSVLFTIPIYFKLKKKETDE